ncbi:hypothetical protein ACOMHN_015716 [Nucella lapillus]
MLVDAVVKVTAFIVLIVSEDVQEPAVRRKSSPGGSSASSRDGSPNRDMSPISRHLSPPIMLKRGPRGYGFGFRSVRVYIGQSNVYTLQHIITDVQDNTPASEAGLKPGDLITHLNEESVQSLLHTQVVHLLSSSSVLNVRCVPLHKTSIQTGSRPKGAAPGKMARKAIKKRQVKDRAVERRKSQKNLLRRLSRGKGDGLLVHGGHVGGSSRPHPPGINRSGEGSPALHRACMRSPPVAMPRSPDTSSPAGSSNSSSPNSSVPNSPAGATAHFGRPSSLHVSKHKKASSIIPSHRRKSVHNVPLSPLARTPSPSNMDTSPARSPSPMTTGMQGHLAGSSHLAQQTIPAYLNAASGHSHSGRSGKHVAKCSHGQGCDCGMPRRALSPELLHPSSAEKLPNSHTFSSPADRLPAPKGPTFRKASLQ